MRVRIVPDQEWCSVTHQDGELAKETFAILHERGPLTAVQHLVLNLDRSVNVEDSDDLGETYTGDLPTYGENDRIDVAGDFVLITNSWWGTIHLRREVPLDTGTRSWRRTMRWPRPVQPRSQR
jgi:hypothetical protein